MSVTPIADMVEEMLSTGIPVDKILLAIRAVERTTSHSKFTDPAAARRRAWDRERKRTQRAEIPPDNDKTHSLSLSTQLQKEKGKKERKSGIVCPPDFHPTEKHYSLGQELGHGRQQIDAMCEDMRQWSGANSNRAIARKADWGLTFIGWIKRNSKRAGNGHTQPGGQQRHGESFAAFAFRRAGEAGGDNGPGVV